MEFKPPEENFYFVLKKKFLDYNFRYLFGLSYLNLVGSFVLYWPVQTIFFVLVPKTVQKHPHFVPV